MPEITIVTPSFNRASLLGRLWKSLTSQEVDFQWVIVDDGSKDNTLQVVEEFQDSRITLKRLPRNMGVNFARNTGVSLAKSEYIIFLDSDDEIAPNRLATAINKIKNTDKEIGVICFACVMADTGEQTSKLIDGSVLNEVDIVCKNALRGGENVYIYKKEIFKDFSLPEDLRGCEHVFVYAISKKWKFLMVDMPLRLIHRQLDNLSGASSLIARSKDIAKSFELILFDHRMVLKDASHAKAALYQKCIYRYGVAGQKMEVLRVAKAALKDGSGKDRFKTIGLTFLALLPLTSFEFWRISRVNEKLEGKTA